MARGRTDQTRRTVVRRGEGSGSAVERMPSVEDATSRSDTVPFRAAGSDACRL